MTLCDHALVATPFGTRTQLLGQSRQKSNSSAHPFSSPPPKVRMLRRIDSSMCRDASRGMSATSTANGAHGSDRALEVLSSLSSRPSSSASVAGVTSSVSLRPRLGDFRPVDNLAIASSSTDVSSAERRPRVTEKRGRCRRRATYD
eukprot:Polyplicarium_translucidae@DN2423_c0_g1_i1.p1